MRIALALCLLGPPLLGGCQFMPHNAFFVAPQNEPNPAWVRIVHYTQHAGIYQFENGVRSGGLIRRNEFVLVHTQDKGMPKAGQDLTFDYYETPVRPDVRTEVSMAYQGERTDYCTVTASFIPEAGRYYQFLLRSDSGVGKCVMYPTLIEKGPQGTGWHLRANPDVSYPKGSPEGTTRYGFEQYRDPAYKAMQPGL